MFDLTGKKALVTGSTQGIGFDIAKKLSEQGATVYINGASGIEKCQKACKMIENSIPVCADLSTEEGCEELYRATGGVDILVLNASVQYKTEWQQVTKSELDRQLALNVTSSVLLIQKYAPYMKDKRWGRIVTIGSVNQYRQHPMLSVYAITKAAQFKFVQNIAPSLAPFGVTINNIAPGAIETPRNEKDLANIEFKKAVEKSIPCGYVGKPEDVSPAVLLLCSEEGRYITGSEIIIDGGMHL